MGEKLGGRRGRGSGRIGENWEEEQSRKNGRKILEEEGERIRKNRRELGRGIE